MTPDGRLRILRNVECGAERTCSLGPWETWVKPGTPGCCLGARPVADSRKELGYWPSFFVCGPPSRPSRAILLIIFSFHVPPAACGPRISSSFLMASPIRLAAFHWRFPRTPLRRKTCFRSNPCASRNLPALATTPPTPRFPPRPSVFTIVGVSTDVPDWMTRNSASVLARSSLVPFRGRTGTVFGTGFPAESPCRCGFSRPARRVSSITCSGSSQKTSMPLMSSLIIMSHLVPRPRFQCKAHS